MIRGFFEPLPALKENVAFLLRSCREEADVLVGIHIRRGDYKDFEGGRYFYEPPQYAALMHRMMSLLSGRKVLFLICSNEPVLVEGFEGLNFRIGNNHLIEDLYSFAQCDYLIGPPSTYTMWASLYGHVPLYHAADLQHPFTLDEFQIIRS